MMLPHLFEQRMGGVRGGRPAPASIRMSLAAEPASVPRARHVVSEFADEHGANAEAVAVAVSEAVGNALIHGYRDGGNGAVGITAKLEADRVVITVEDDGVGMRPHPNAPGLGLGLPLVGRFADSLEIESRQQGTRLVMGFLRWP
jgi:stage II sporulation protein AB (anti-sigma F factor)